MYEWDTKGRAVLYLKILKIAYLILKVVKAHKELYDTIHDLIMDKEISSYKINKETGISYSAIDALRRGERQVKNLTLETAFKLYEYAKSEEGQIT